jgi:hypothetical protein
MGPGPRTLRYQRRLQDGIYFRRSERPGSCWRLLLLDIVAGTTPPEAGAALASLWAISFQRDLARVSLMLDNPAWLGSANFGGDGRLELLTLLAGGFYAVPPAADPFPGAEIF